MAKIIGDSSQSKVAEPDKSRILYFASCWM